MIILNNCSLPLETDFSDMRKIAADIIKTDKSNILLAKLHRKSIDARRKSDVHFCCSIIVELKGNEKKVLSTFKNASVFAEKRYTFARCNKRTKTPVVVIGFGPAGMFAALTLARAGLKPVVFERGCDVDTRSDDVNRFLCGGELKENSNIQFGEGGAGTFSDGKLNTGIKDIRCRAVLETFAEFGADSSILTDAKPHIGTDILKKVVKNIRAQIIECGGRVEFSSKLEDITFDSGKLTHIKVNGENINCENVIMCVGHSARDTFEMLKKKEILMEKKPFSMGVRIEHLQSDINNALYGKFAQNKALGAADYKMAVHLENGRGVYTFCMCPGGEVINASSEQGGICINGMSNSARSGENANSALLVGITPDDISGDDVLAGCYLQRSIEQKAYHIAGGAVPITTVGEFVYSEQAKIGEIRPTVKPGYVICDFKDIYPDFIIESLKQGIVQFGKKIEGFCRPDAILTAPETRSSCPIRILRNENGVSVSVRGLYPCGEGAGYAGGIMSAAVDGIRQAENLISNLII